MSGGHGPVSISTTVEILPEDFVDELSPAQKQRMLQALSAWSSEQRAPDGRPLEMVIENAYSVAKGIPDLPRELRDLFWIVHGRPL